MSSSATGRADIQAAQHVGMKSRESFRPDIEGLRAIGVLLVVAYHVGIPGLRGGFIGVDVFFVISGYLITGLLFRELAATSHIAFLRFYARRARRLLPASALMLLGTLAGCHFLLPPLEQGKLIRTAWATVLYVSNIYFAQSTRDYFAGGNASNPLLHTWSLAVEEQFYLIWPLLLFVLYRLRRSRAVVLSAITLLSAISFGYCLWATRENQAAAFFMLPVRAWEFGIGAALSVAGERWQLPRKLALLLGGIGLCGIALASVCLSPGTHFPGYAALLPALGTGALLLAGKVVPREGAGKFLCLPVMQWVGELSYSLYLWHWPLLVFAAARWPGFGLSGRIAVAVLSLGVAALTHYVYENPIRFHRLLTPRPALSLALAGCVTMVSLCGIVLWRSAVKSSPLYAKYGSAANDQPRLYDLGCSTGFTDVAPKECQFGDKNSATRIVLFGDSHAAQWFPALDELAAQHQWLLTTYIRNACPAVFVPAYDKNFGRQHEECSKWRELAFARLIALHPNVVVIGSREYYHKEVHGGVTLLSYDDWRQGTEQAFKRLQAAGIQVLLVEDTPRPGFDVPDCLAQVASGISRSCGHYPRSAPELDTAHRAEEDAAKPFSNVHIIDPAEQMCDGPNCDTVRDGIIVFRDDNHLTVSFAKSRAAMFAKSLDAMLKEHNSATAEYREAGTHP